MSCGSVEWAYEIQDKEEELVLTVIAFCGQIDVQDEEVGEVAGGVQRVCCSLLGSPTRVIYDLIDVIHNLFMAAVTVPTTTTFLPSTPQSTSPPQKYTSQQ